MRIHVLLVAIFYFCFSFTALAQQKNELPTIGVAGGATLSLEKEKIIGDFYMREINRYLPVISDPVLNEYLFTLGNTLVKHADHVNYPFSFFIIQDSSINAFAFLGGYIGVHTGLFLSAEDESELASVLGHEIAHVTQRHLARNMERMTEAASMTTAQLIASLAISLVNPVAGMASLSASIAGIQQKSINYTRQFELEADRVGLDILYRSGFDPNGSPRFFSRLADQFRYSANIPQYLVTHPLPDNRVSDTKARANKFPQVQVPVSLEFELAKIRIRTFYTKRRDKDIHLDFLSELKKEQHATKKTALEYGLALSHFQLKEYDEALALITTLRAKDPFNLFYIDLMADIYLSLGQGQQALDMLTLEYQRRPNNHVITLNLANVANKMEAFDLTHQVLSYYLIKQKSDILAWELLYVAYHQSGRAVDMHEAQAEIRALRGDFRSAIEELHQAISKLPKEKSLTRQRLQARIEQFKELEAERKRVA